MSLKIYSLVKRLIGVKIIHFEECNNMCESRDLGKYRF